MSRRVKEVRQKVPNISHMDILHKILNPRVGDIGAIASVAFQYRPIPEWLFVYGMTAHRKDKR